MDMREIQILADVNRAFYERNADSFSETRRNGWDGWARVAEEIQSMRSAGMQLDILDIACGNMRFERYLSDIDENLFTHAYAIDNCSELQEFSNRTTFIRCDVIECLMSGLPFEQVLGAPKCPVTVVFGFMHHIPSFELRFEFLRQACAMTHPGGLMALSFWQFMNDDAYARKVREAQAATQQELGLILEENDFILGWQGDSSNKRYCHHFDDAEIERLVSPLEECRIMAEYSADGRNDSMNRYVLLRKL